MKAPECPIDEEFRLEALHELHLLDSAPNERLDRIVRIAKELFQVEICLISLVDSNRQWFKSKLGLDAAETPRDISFCGHAILEDDVFVILNAKNDPRFHDNPLVVGGPQIRFYAGMPLKLPNGYKIGTLCIISPKPRKDFGADELALMRDLGALVIDQIALDEVRHAKDHLSDRIDRYGILTEVSTVPLALFDSHGKISNFNNAFARGVRRQIQDNEDISVIINLPSNWQQDLELQGEISIQLNDTDDNPARIFPFRGGFILAG